MSTHAKTSQREFLGRGWKFPLQVTPRGAIASARGDQRIEESIYIILSTAPGERVMQPQFGCGIHDLVFEPNSVVTRSLVIDRVRRALVTFEPRVDVLTVNADATPEQPNLLLIRVDYRIRATNTFGNLVYPFYITEAT
jgi:phage baseplate assembly protein W